EVGDDLLIQRAADDLKVAALLNDRIESEVHESVWHSVVDRRKHRNRTLLFRAKRLDDLDSFFELLELSLEIVLALDVAFELLCFVLFALQILLGRRVRAVCPQVVGAHGDDKDGERGGEHEDLLATPGGDLCLLDRYSVFGGALK